MEVLVPVLCWQFFLKMCLETSWIRLIHQYSLAKFNQLENLPLLDQWKLIHFSFQFSTE